MGCILITCQNSDRIFDWWQTRSDMFSFYFVQVSGASAKGNSNLDHNFTLSFQKFTHIHIIVDLYLRKIIGTLTMKYHFPLNFDIASTERNSNISATILKKNHWEVSPNAIFPLHTNLYCYKIYWYSSLRYEI